jgi:hypothetical protein
MILPIVLVEIKTIILEIWIDKLMFSEEIDKKVYYFIILYFYILYNIFHKKKH